MAFFRFEPPWKKHKKSKSGKENRQERKKEKHRTSTNTTTELPETQIGYQASESQIAVNSSNHEFVTVNMDDLGEMYSKPLEPSPSKKQQFFAKKSDPVPSSKSKKHKAKYEDKDEENESPKASKGFKCQTCGKHFKKHSNLTLVS